MICDSKDLLKNCCYHIDWFLYHKDLRQERVKGNIFKIYHFLAEVTLDCN